MKSRTLVMGDIHGGFKALLQVLERCEFNPKEDTLIQLGDIADGWSETWEIVDYFIKLKEKHPHHIFIRGNHDNWLHDYLLYGMQPLIWTQQGGKATIDSYLKDDRIANVEKHREFMRNQIDYHIDDKNRLFIHGGWYYPSGFPEGATSKVNAGTIAKECHWDRSLFETAKSAHLMRKNSPLAYKKFTALDQFNEVYIGHTARDKGPENYLNLWNIDTGAGWSGVLTIMDIDTKENWQSDKLSELYFGENGR